MAVRTVLGDVPPEPLGVCDRDLRRQSGPRFRYGMAEIVVTK